MPPASRLAICFCLGALLGTVLDGIHVYGDVESYPDPLFGRWAWFVPLEFGLAGALAGAVIPALERIAGPSSPPRWPLAVRAAELALIVAAYLSTVLLDDEPVLVTAGLIVMLAIRLTFRPVSGDWLYALVGALAGSMTEVAISALGAFDYADPDVAGIPMWLPALWANGGIFIRRLLAPVVLEDYRSRSSTSPPSAPT
jgi:hypothetical protein